MPKSSTSLRTPSAIIYGKIELLMKPNLDDTRKSIIIETLLRNSKRLNLLIDNMRHSMKIEKFLHKLNKNHVNISDLTEGIKSEMEVFSNKKGVTLNYNSNSANKKIIGNIDEDKIAQVLRNVIHNSIKFTNSGGNISISLKKKKNLILIEVRDIGKGLTEEEKIIMFEAFKHVREYVHKEGMGLGLYISNKIVQLHGGRIEAFSEGLDTGSTIQILLPISSLV